VYKVQEFAELAGVTVRALHHYDRLGLLKPGGRTQSGYRLYNDGDLARLEQIVVLKFLGLPLKEIRELLTRESNLQDSLRRQQAVLAEKRGQLDAAIEAIRKAEKSLQIKREPDWGLFTKIIKEIEMQNDTNWTKQYFSEEAKTAVEERKGLWSPELQERVSREWAQLFADVEAALGENPASAKAQELASRWRKLVSEFTGGNPEIQKGLNRMYSDQGNWPEQPKQNWQIKPEIMSFIMAAMKAG
jgi:MerR family transcriptional regulator, thiopeptide resistance regulator